MYQHVVKSIDSTQVVDKHRFNNVSPKKVSLREGKNYFTRNTQIKRRIWVICYQEATIGFWTR